MYAVSPGVSSFIEGKIKNTVVGGEDVGGSVTTALTFQEPQDSSWLYIKRFPGGHLGFKDRAAGDKYQEIGDIAVKSMFNGATDRQAEDESQKMNHNVDRIEDGPGTKDRVEHSGEESIADPGIDGAGVGDSGFHSKKGYMDGVGGNAEDWGYSRASFMSELTLQL